MASNIKLEEYKLPSLPDSIYYIPNFLTPTEESHILTSLPPRKWISLSHRRLQTHPSQLSKSNTLLASPLPTYLSIPIIPKFKDLGLFESSPHKAPNHVLVNEYNPGQGIMPHKDGPAYFEIVATVSLGAAIVLDVYPEPNNQNQNQNHIMINNNQNNDDGNNHDGDGERESSKPIPKWRILQEPRSLLVTTRQAYTNLLHGISELPIDKRLSEDTVANWNLLDEETKTEIQMGGGERARDATRTSLTYRDVLKVSEIGARIFGRPRG